MPTAPIETIAPDPDDKGPQVETKSKTDIPEATLADERYRRAFETIVDAESMAFLDFNYFGIREEEDIPDSLSGRITSPNVELTGETPIERVVEYRNLKWEQIEAAERVLEGSKEFDDIRAAYYLAQEHLYWLTRNDRELRDTLAQLGRFETSSVEGFSEFLDEVSRTRGNKLQTAYFASIYMNDMYLQELKRQKEQD